jgi:hypothetical protein
MTNLLAVALAVVTAIGSGLVAGFFFAFSICVMRALARHRCHAVHQRGGPEPVVLYGVLRNRRGMPGACHHRDPELARVGGPLSADR